MRKIAPGVFVEDKYPAVTIGAVVTQQGVILVDSPLRADDTRAWMASLADLGRPRYMALLDSHPDRVLGARMASFTLVGHDWTRLIMSAWSDSFKGNTNPIGADADGLKRITGVRRAIPELTFSGEMRIRLGEREFQFLHRPGPTPGSIWMLVPDAKAIFIGDTVTVKEPPYLGHAEIEKWLETLQDLRHSRFRSFKLISGRDGLIKRDDINAMARFLRRIPHRIRDFSERGEAPEAVGNYAQQLIRSYKAIAPARMDLSMLRLKTGLIHLYTKMYPSES